ncbi:MAG: MmgE/PrpD family protein [Chloroflexi bacterium]|nr:MmgE/PrpD family protein [Chloroflexota bacterium]
MNETRALVEFVVGSNYADLPKEIVETVRLFILDDLACGFAGARAPWADMVATVVRDSTAGSNSMFGRAWTASPAQAALVNGVSIGGFECDHVYSPGSCHPSAGVFPAVLAAAEQGHIDGRGFLTAVALGYEILCRIGAAATRAVEDERGFHGPGTNAALGAAFGVGKALGLSEKVLLNAVGIAGSHGSGLLEFFHEGAMTKRMHPGRGSQLGLECVLLAQQGFTGPSTVLEGAQGFLNVYSPSPKPERLLSGLGQDYLLREITLKAYPCHISFHPTIDALQHFRAENPFDIQMIQHVKIVSETRMMESRFGGRRPTNLLGAQYSLPWSAALALSWDVADPAAWTERDLADPMVSHLAATMELDESKPAGFGANAEVELTVGGQRHVVTATDWKGAPTNPYTFQEMAEKFRRYVGDQLTNGTTEEIIARVERLEHEADVASLARLIRGVE